MIVRNCGDHHNTPCPHCWGDNYNILKGVKVKANTVAYFQKPCAHCGKIVYYWVTHEITVEAFSEDLNTVE